MFTKITAPTPTPDNEIKIKKPSTDVGSYFDSIMNWIGSHPVLVGRTLAVIIVTGAVITICRKLPKPALIFVVFAVALGTGIISTKIGK